MAYTVMKLHKRYLMPLESLDEFCNYLQIKLEKDFYFDDDTVISTMERGMEELKRAKLDCPGVPLPHELPRIPFGTFKEPSFTSKVINIYTIIYSTIYINALEYVTPHGTTTLHSNLRGYLCLWKNIPWERFSLKKI